MADDNISETEDVGDLWLTFWVCAALSGVVAFAVLKFIASTGWALAGAIPVALVVGWAFCSVRPLRRFVSHAVQLIAFPWW